MSHPDRWKHARWKVSSRSGNGVQCVEQAAIADTIGVRDSKNRAAGLLEFDPAAWSRFLVDLKR
ncbi:hypothetical protein GCM10022243_45770 [Saccharothrix violaceirubra]|uniref:DUF397 domain-containing protein n=1 Tax=Saccharothrix violaceirubra TaxID=413306 RepID=A0A7W7WVH3_9PSEU|nr:DUF397 domain-containing protein [Saccharothrix violaceirubra]MBB4964533.1 hypothetical protein [Saccharothrix violaceirubra]